MNHPNIAAIHGFEEAHGVKAVKALVMELVNGETLADRIARGPISVDEALPIAKQIAEALEAAHEALQFSGTSRLARPRSPRMGTSPRTSGVS